MGQKKVTNGINLSNADIAKLIEASESEEVSVHENHTREQQINYLGDSNHREISFQSTAAGGHKIGNGKTCIGCSIQFYN
ncbi:hypothetical protein TNCT_508301 [Trichonephila clavata]|uniref:Uncharacterized protein n=1 Tax=Trichonephila clavata TaxID=2740835 RepID=A0A8X6HAZ4_TRICU|nr:hypothetical protein TNCT_508301 [Trichonephila clavata]